MPTDKKLEEHETRMVVAGDGQPSSSEPAQDVARRRPLRPAGEPGGTGGGGELPPGPQ
jgi:hypothetical protein